MLTTAKGRKGAVTSPHHLASQAGLDVLAEGGTAVEAAIAIAAALVVVYPHMNSLGGDGFWLIAQPGRPPLGIESAGRSAAKATLDLYREAGLEAVPWRGPLAANTVAVDAKTIVIQRTTIYINTLPGGCVKKVYSGGIVVWKCGRYYYQPYNGRYVRVIIN